MRFRKIFGQEAMVRYLAADPVDLETSRLLRGQLIRQILTLIWVLYIRLM